MIQVSKQDINQLDIADWATAPLKDLAKLAKETHKLSRFSTWLLPQLVAWFGTWQVYSSGKEMVVKNCATIQQRALYRLAMCTRSSLIANQVKTPEYGQLTPLILLGLKRSQGIPYEHWRDYPELDRILEPELYNALANQTQPEITTERLLELQNIGLTIKSSTVDPKKVGTLNRAASHYGLTGLQGTEIAGLDKIAQMIVCQTWLAHPQVRRETMILSLGNWDHMPKPLVEWQPVPAPKINIKTPKVSIHDELIFD